MRKQNFKIQMLAGNNLKSFPDARSRKTMTLGMGINLLIVKVIVIDNEMQSH